MRLCRFVKSSALWTCLAGMALHYQHLDTAEIALAAINEVRLGALLGARLPLLACINNYENRSTSCTTCCT